MAAQGGAGVVKNTLATRPAFDGAASDERHGAPTAAQLRWLARGLDQPGGKLPLFDERGQRVNERTVKSCIDRGWAAPWFHNPLKPDWLVCKVTEAGRRVLAVSGYGRDEDVAPTGSAGPGLASTQ
jgi:hypothetical protein